MNPLVKSAGDPGACFSKPWVAKRSTLHPALLAALFSILSATVLLGMSPHVWSQTPSAAAADVHGAYPGGPAAPTGSVPPAPSTWHEANRQVSDFPRGHIDLLRWEQKNLTALPGVDAHPDTGQMTLTRAVRLALQDEAKWLKPGMSAIEQAEVRQQAAVVRRDIQKLWVDAVASRQSVAHSRDILAVAQAGAELGQRMATVGNWSRARQIPEELSLWEARARLEKAQLQEGRALHALWQRIGANMTVQALAQQLPLSLPMNVPMSSVPINSLNEQAENPFIETMTGRNQSKGLNDLNKLEALESQALQANLRWTTQDQHASRLMSGVGLNAQGLQAAQQVMNKWAADDLPQWDPRTMRRGHDVENAWQARLQADRLARQVRADVQTAVSAFLLAQQSSVHTQSAVVRLHTELSQETLLRYNGMLKSTWDLLASARTRIDSVDAALQAQRQVWHAHAELLAVLAGLPYTVVASDSAGTPRLSTNAAGH